MSKYTTQDIVLFWDKVNKNGTLQQHCPELGICWEWTGGFFHDNYGLFSHNSKNKRAHRVVWEIVHGNIPDNLCVLHKCDNPKCVNPIHLFLGTKGDNNLDKQRKGRQPHGERYKTHKLSVTQVGCIIDRYRMGGITQRELATEYNISASMVCDIVNRKKRKYG